MRLLFLILMLLFSLHAEGDAKKVVFDLTIGDINRFEQFVLKGTETLAIHYAEERKEYKPVFIIHGDAYRFFLKDLNGTPYEGDKVLADRRKALESHLKSLVEHYDVIFEVCSVGMRKKQLPFEKLYTFVTPIFNATAGLVEWQEKGYAYIMVK